MNNPSSHAILAALTLLTIAASPAALAQQNSDLPRIIGTELPGTTQSTINITIDGNRISAFGNDYGGFIPDVDGDGIAEAYLRTTEPGQTCTTLIYLPSKQARSANLQSNNLSGYTRIRNFHFQTGAANADEACTQTQNSIRLRNMGDMTGDGIDEIATLYTYHGYGEIIVDGTAPVGTHIELDNPVPGLMSLIDGNLSFEPVGDLNGDGRVDWYMWLTSGSDYDNYFYETCSIFASQATLRQDISFSSLGGDTPLATLPRSEYENCPYITPIGDVNGDGIDDIIIQNEYDAPRYVVHGNAGRLLGENYQQEGYRIIGTCNNAVCSKPMDFDADGFDDVLAQVTENSENGLLAGTGTVILYGGPDGLLKADDFSSRSPERVTEIIQKFEKPVLNSYGWDTTHTPSNGGDINGDGASDLVVESYFNYGDLQKSSYGIIYGTPEKRPQILLQASLDGGNGVAWSEENNYYQQADSFDDFTGDGIDDITYNTRLIHGSSRMRLAADPEDVHLFDGPDSTDIYWNAPADTSNLASYRIVKNGQQVASVEIDQNQYRLTKSDTLPITELRIQSVDHSGSIIGESIKHLDLTASEYSDFQPLLNDVEYTAMGDVIQADKYTLTGKSYGPELGELFWNTTKRFVLIWRDGKIIDRTEGNSYMVHGGGEFFITTDYFGSVPGADTQEYFTSGTLRRSNVVSVNMTTPVKPPVVEPPTTEGAPNTPTSLRADVYSDTAAELFWDRSATSDNIIAYKIKRDGVLLASTTGTSYFDATRQPGNGYTYTVTAVAQGDVRSTPASISTESFNNHGGGGTNPPEELSFVITGQVYSSSALELFWNTNDIDGGNALTFEILQNGLSVKNTNGRSYYADRLYAHTKYNYKIVARNADGDIVARSNKLLLSTR